MRARYVGMLASLLALGCAHGQPNQGAPGRASAAHSKAAERAAHEPPEQRAERQLQAQENEAAEQQALATEQQLQHGRTAEDFGTQPDNTRVNERDRDSASLTPLDQSEDERDRELTAQIRRAMIGDSSLSFTAKNTKIITRDGLVTLRGVVANAREKATIQKTAQQIAGKDHVVDELEVER